PWGRPGGGSIQAWTWSSRRSTTWAWRARSASGPRASRSPPACATRSPRAWRIPGPHSSTSRSIAASRRCDGLTSESGRRGESVNESVQRTGGEWIVPALPAQGGRHVFGDSGVHHLAIYDALIRQSEITHVLARHEAGATFMADGYARASGAPGVVVVTTGPGATNALTPLVESYAGSMPVVVVMSDVAS